MSADMLPGHTAEHPSPKGITFLPGSARSCPHGPALCSKIAILPEKHELLTHYMSYSLLYHYRRLPACLLGSETSQFPSSTHLAE